MPTARTQPGTVRKPFHTEKGGDSKPIQTGQRGDRSHETTESGIPWLAFARHRQEIRKQWNFPWQLRIVRNMLDPLRDAGANGSDILDIGATDRLWEQPIQDLIPSAHYRSFDLDRTNAHDYHDYAEVDRDFDGMLCLEVLEHLSPAQGAEMLRWCSSRLKPGGWLLASVPNRLVAYHQLEFTHQTAIGHQDLGALYLHAGLEVTDIARLCTEPTWEVMLHRTVLRPVHRLFKTDFARSIVALGYKPMTSEDSGFNDAPESAAA